MLNTVDVRIDLSNGMLDVWGVEPKALMAALEHRRDLVVLGKGCDGAVSIIPCDPAKLHEVRLDVMRVLDKLEMLRVRAVKKKRDSLRHEAQLAEARRLLKIKPTITVRELAQQLGVSVGTSYKLKNSIS